MEAIKIIKTVSGDSLYIDGLSQFDGQEVEVIVLPAAVEDIQEKKVKKEFFNSLKKHSFKLPEEYKFSREEIYDEE
ncbi:MAG: hypothetical protein SFU25_04450 [Candidatus Caenarcaniphilales bacterium]|nr:hypothetical protein [Candidatus Caenarcaniphilales bacterium]